MILDMCIFASTRLVSAVLFGMYLTEAGQQHDGGYLLALLGSLADGRCSFRGQRLD